MRILALYLPQYHEIEENSRWWGEGYTEWTAVKRAIPLFKGHKQPNIPLDNNYYNLADEDARAWKWQANLAKEYGVYGFCIYHYWFGEKQLLEKPMEILLRHKEIDLKYCICWANETWTRTWYGKETEVLIEQTYGGKKEWRLHYEYLSQFFKDNRYIKENNKPLIHIYRQADIQKLDEMLELWNELAILDGFSGLEVITAQNSIGNAPLKSKFITGEYRFEPGYATRNGLNLIDKIKYFAPIAVNQIFNRITGKELLERKIDIRAINKRIIKNYISDKRIAKKTPVYMGVCPMWDNTPRRGNKGSVYINSSPDEFRNILRKIKNLVDENEFVYVNAWNEWGEGCYLEPDVIDKYKYLEAIREIQVSDS